MIESIYSKYFQKSKSFLYPLLGIKRTSYYNPLETYIVLEGIVKFDDMTLICCFANNESESYKSFEKKMILDNPLYVKSINTPDYKLYLFDYSEYKTDWFNFIAGKYSKLSSLFKDAIKEYYGENSLEYKYVETYLYPEKYFITYAKILGVDVNDLKEVGELCDPYNLEKETLKISVDLLDMSNKVL